jgi:hypothetical protein
MSGRDVGTHGDIAGVFGDQAVFEGKNLRLFFD